MTDPVTIVAAVTGVAASPLVALAVVKQRMKALEDRTTEFKVDVNKDIEDLKTSLKDNIDEVKRDKADRVLVEAYDTRITRLEEHLGSKLDEILHEVRRKEA